MPCPDCEQAERRAREAEERRDHYINLYTQKNSLLHSLIAAVEEHERAMGSLSGSALVRKAENRRLYERVRSISEGEA